MSDPDALRSIFEDHSDLEMNNLAKPNPILKLRWSIQSIRSLQATRHQQCPIMALPIDPQPTPTVPIVVSELLHLHPIILPLLLLFQPTHYSLHVYDPKDHIMWRRHHGSREGNVLYQDRRSE